MSNVSEALSAEFLQEAKKSILFTTQRPEVIMERGQGMHLWDTAGKQYLDFVGGWAVTSLGHSPAVIAEALEKQSRLLVNASPAFYNTSMLKFAKLLTDISCFDRVFFASSGAEANESAIKLARKYGALYRGGAFEIITMINSFHGRTLATMSATGKEKWRTLFEPKVPGFRHVPLNDAVALQAAVSDKTCAIMLEPIQGEGGVYAATAEYMNLLRRICTENNILLIVDEVQTGFYRTGKLFASNYWDVAPDIICMAKSMAGGVPISAVTARAELMEKLIPGSVGGTYCGNPMACASALKCIEIYERDNYEAKSLHIGELCKKRLEEMKKKYQIIGDIRVLGAMIGVEFVKDRKTKEPAAQACHDILELAFKGGVKIYYCGSLDNVMRFLTPLVVTDEQMNEGLDVIEKAIAKVNAETLK